MSFLKTIYQNQTSKMEALYNACVNGDLSGVKEMVAAGTEVDFTLEIDNKTVSPLSAAVKHGHIELAEYLIINGANVNIYPIDESIMLTAVRSYNIAMVRMLLDSNGDVDCCNHRSESLLSWVVYLDYPEMVEMLIDYGADVNITDQDGNTPLHIACMYNKTNIVKILLSKGADCNIINDEKSRPYDLTWSDEIRDIINDHLNSIPDIKEPD